MITYTAVIVASWIAFILVWAVLSFGVKRDIRGGGIAQIVRNHFVLRLAVSAFLVFMGISIAKRAAHSPHFDSAFFTKAVFMPPLFLGWAAALCAVAGILFAVWARLHLGANWSPAPAVKEHHELVTSGPYRWVRHPIYTGVILAALGSALAGTVFGMFAFAAATLVFFLRIEKEERIMLELFPDTYPAYQARTKKLVPFVW